LSKKAFEQRRETFQRSQWGAGRGERDMRHIIIGGSAAAISAIEAIRSIDLASRIDLFSDEGTPLFSRVLLPYYIAEELSKQLLNFRPLDFFDEYNVTPHLGIRVQKISTDSRTIQTEDGNDYEFDKLLLATGGKPIVPPIPGTDKEGVSTLKYLEDAERIYNFKGTKAVVVGAGTVGVEASISLKRRGLKVSLLEQLGQVLPNVFDEEASFIIREIIEDKGIEVITGEQAVQFNGDNHIRTVVTDKREIECDMVVLACGVSPAVELAQKAGIEIGSLGGLKVNGQMMTSFPDIYGAGDVAETYDISRDMDGINAIWPCAVEQGRIAGLNMVGRKTRYAGSIRMNSIGNFIGLPAVSMGIISDHGHEFQEIKRRAKDTYRKIVLRDGRIVGAILVGQTQKAGIYTTLLRKKVDVSNYVPLLMSDRVNFADLMPLIKENAGRFTEIQYRELMTNCLQ
jgi:NAD(P)H-nitrite reductase large subunit